MGAGIHRQLIYYGILLFVAIPFQAMGFEERELFPFDERHLTYKDFKSDLESIANFISSNCDRDESKLAELVKESYIEMCKFPKLLQELRDATKAANDSFASLELETRPQAQFIDLEYGWVLRTPFSLSNKSHSPLLRLLLIKAAIQKAVDHISYMWMVWGLRGSITGRLYIVPKFSAGLERDVILARTMRYASAIRCLDKQGLVEEPCMKNRLSLALPLNEILSEFQSKKIEPTLEVQSYYELSNSFRLQLRAWLEAHNSASSILQALKENPPDLVELDRIYGALIDLPKRIKADNINKSVAQLNVSRYVGELKPVDPVYTDYLKRNEVMLTPEIIGILAKIRKQLSIYYPEKE